MRALIVGLGAVGQRHARNLRALRPDIDLVAWRQRGRPGIITDTMELVPGDVERDLGIRAFAGLELALATRPDLAVICGPTSEHAAVAHRAAAAGCHLYIEKPVSHALDGLARLQQVVAGARLVVAVGCQWRFHPCVERVRELVERGMLGTLRGARFDFSEYLPDWHPYEDYRESYAARADLGGGVVLAQIHDYDLAWWLFGPPRSVMAVDGSDGSLAIDAETAVQAQLDAACPVTVRQTMAERDSRRGISVRGERGEVTCDLLSATLTSTVAGVEVLQLKEFQRNTMFRRAMEDFLHCVDRGAAPRTGLADGIAVLRVALAVKDSMRRRAPVAVT